jgi:hypothetical protein
VDLKKKIRLNVNLPEEIYNILTDLESKMNVSKGDVLRKALRLVKVIFDAEKEGKEIQIVDKYMMSQKILYKNL